MHGFHENRLGSVSAGPSFRLEQWSLARLAILCNARLLFFFSLLVYGSLKPVESSVVGQRVSICFMSLFERDAADPCPSFCALLVACWGQNSTLEHKHPRPYIDLWNQTESEDRNICPDEQSVQKELSYPIGSFLLLLQKS